MFEDTLLVLALEERTKGMDVEGPLRERNRWEKLTDNRFLGTLIRSLLFGSLFLAFVLSLVVMRLGVPTFAPKHAALFLAIALPLGLAAACSGFLGALCWAEMPDQKTWDRMIVVKYQSQETRR